MKLMHQGGNKLKRVRKRKSVEWKSCQKGVFGSIWWLLG